MNILVLAPQPFFQNRGTPIATRQLLEVLSAQGHTLDVLAYHEGEDVNITGCTIHRTAALPGLSGIRPGPSIKKIVCDILMFIKCLRMLRRGHWDLIHAGEESVFIALVMKWIFGMPYIYDMDSSLPRQLSDKYWLLRPVAFVLRWFERMAVRGSDGVVAVCKSLEDEARRYDPTTPIVRIEDVSLIDLNAKGDENLRETLSADGPLVMYVGNLESYQGIDLLLNAFVHLYYARPDVRLVVIGGSPRDITKYKRLAAHFGVDDRIHFLGPRPIDSLGYYLCQADVLVSPRTEGNNTPMKIYSYLDSGRALLATRLPTHTQVLDDQIAYLVDPTPLAMAHGLERLLGDQGRREQLAESARERLQNHYSVEVQSNKLTTFYENVQDSLAHAT